MVSDKGFIKHKVIVNRNIIQARAESKPGEKTIAEIIDARDMLESNIQILIDEFEGNCLIQVGALEIKRTRFHKNCHINVKLDFFDAGEEMMLGINSK